MKKRNLWYITLFLIIFGLSVYYVTIPNELLNTVDTETKKTEVVEKIEEVDSLTTLRVNLEQERLEAVEVIQSEMTKSESTEEKNTLYEKIKYINGLAGEEEKLEKELKKELKLNCFVKIDNSNISSICVSDDSDYNLANKVMRVIQGKYEEKKFISVKFQKS